MTAAVFFPPNEEELLALARTWVIAGKLIRDKYGHELDQSENDLTCLQRVIDDRLINVQDPHALECLGVVFGRVLAHKVDGLDWWIVEDQYGRATVIRYEQTSLQFNALHLLGKRLSKGETVDVIAMYSWVVEKARELKDQVD